MKTNRFLSAAIFALAITFTLNSCASKAQQAAAAGFETVFT